MLRKATNELVSQWTGVRRRKEHRKDTERKSHNLLAGIFQPQFSQKYFLYGQPAAP